MQRILSKRVLRDIRENLLRYLALFFLVALVMYMVVAIVGAAETIMQGTKEKERFPEFLNLLVPKKQG